MLDGVRRVVIVPGYGMAVSQAQHAVRELFNMLESRGTEVEFGIHPVAGRMPGHMNVLLAEADIPYDKLKEMDEINPTFAQTDVVIVIGANDVVNPLANTDPKSPIAGMPILNVGEARTVVVVKRSLSPGFRRHPEPPFCRRQHLMLFEDGKKAWWTSSPPSKPLHKPYSRAIRRYFPRGPVVLRPMIPVEKGNPSLQSVDNVSLNRFNCSSSVESCSMPDMVPLSMLRCGQVAVVSQIVGASSRFAASRS